MSRLATAYTAGLLLSLGFLLAVGLQALTGSVWPCCSLPPLADNVGGAMLHVRPVDAWQLGLGLCGFLMAKVAVVAVGLTTPDSASAGLPEPKNALEKNVQ